MTTPAETRAPILIGLDGVQPLKTGATVYNGPSVQGKTRLGIEFNVVVFESVGIVEL
jgi:hypothetical protein